jgi:cell division septum initiation protein DivIVA
MDELMTEFDDVKADLDAVKADLATIAAGVSGLQTTATAQAQQIADLQAQIAAGTPVTVEQLAALKAQADDLKAQADGVAATLPTQSA